MKKYNWVYDGLFIVLSFVLWRLVYIEQIESNYSTVYLHANAGKLFISSCTLLVASFFCLRSATKWLMSVNKSMIVNLNFLFFISTFIYIISLIGWFHFDHSYEALQSSDVFGNIFFSFGEALLVFIGRLLFVVFGSNLELLTTKAARF